MAVYEINRDDENVNDSYASFFGINDCFSPTLRCDNCNTEFSNRQFEFDGLVRGVRISNRPLKCKTCGKPHVCVFEVTSARLFTSRRNEPIGEQDISPEAREKFRNGILICPKCTHEFKMVKERFMFPAGEEIAYDYIGFECSSSLEEAISYLTVCPECDAKWRYVFHV